MVKLFSDVRRKQRKFKDHLFLQTFLKGERKIQYK